MTSDLPISFNPVRHFRGGVMGAWGTGLYSGDFERVQTEVLAAAGTVIGALCGVQSFGSQPRAEKRDREGIEPRPAHNAASSNSIMLRLPAMIAADKPLVCGSRRSMKNQAVPIFAL